MCFALTTSPPDSFRCLADRLFMKSCVVPITILDQSVEHGRGAAVLPCGMVLAGGRREVVGT